MELLDDIVFAIRCAGREHQRRRLSVVSGENPIIQAQSAAWPDRERLRGQWNLERFVVFDTETTGLNPKVDHAVSLGAVSLINNRIQLGDTFSRVIASETPSSRRSIVVHGLTPDKIAEGTEPRDVLNDFLLWAGNAVLVAHHAAFDMAMLNRLSSRADNMRLQNLVLDTAHLARRLKKGRDQPYDLDSLLAEYGIPAAGARHTALGDALLTARLLQKLLRQLAGHGVTTLRSLALPGPGPSGMSHGLSI
jgi:DNA polymerase-3 subunit epsilon